MPIGSERGVWKAKVELRSEGRHPVLRSVPGVWPLARDRPPLAGVSGKEHPCSDGRYVDYLVRPYANLGRQG